MKVCTDSCLFGAWIADKFESKDLTAKRILDIGCGTGLLSLMVAQKTEAAIDAVEVEDAAYNEAKENVAASPWHSQIKVIHDDIKDFGKKKYDLIICNPPFYEHDLKSPESTINIARHNDELTLTQLHDVTDRLLSAKGSFFVLLPYSRLQYFEEVFCEDLFIKEMLLVRQTEKHKFFRAILQLQRTEIAGTLNEMTIKNASEYSGAFKNLLKDYYLQLETS
ncbi:tRNA1(Val) (adenine(37)-N6)-methyltransferase [soil metagenome]